MESKQDWNFSEIGPSSEPPSTFETFRDPFDNLAIAFACSTLLPMAVFGIIANLCTIIIVYQTPGLRSIFNYYIISLCLSDFISALISPLGVYQRIWGYRKFSIPSFFCKVSWGGEMLTSIATSFHIAAFAGLRFISIAKPHFFSRITLMQAKISIYFIWIFSIGLGFVPYVIFMGVTEIDRTANIPNRTWPACSMLLLWLPRFRVFNLFGYPIFFYIPFLLIFILSFASSVAICTKRSQRAKARQKHSRAFEITESEISRRAKENQAIIQLALIVGSFAIGYLPLTSFLTIAPFISVKTNYELRSYWWFGNSCFVLLRFSECLNPIFYNLASSKLRRETILWIKKACVFPKTTRVNKENPTQRTTAKQPQQNIPT